MKDQTTLKTTQKKKKKSSSLFKKQRPPKSKMIYTPNNYNNGIAMSKQLVQKLKTSNNSIGRTKPRSAKNLISNEPRLCGNGKPMPSLIELEQMFNDSDSDDEPKQFSSFDLNTKNSTNTSSCSTPNKTTSLSDDKLKSPGTIKSIADKMINYISNLADATVQLDDDTSPAIPQKKPYFVGCIDCPKVPCKPTVNFCKGNDYGIKESSNSGGKDETCKTRVKMTNIINHSKSIFNAKSDEIAACLKELESPLNLTDNGGYRSANNTDTSKSFSPIPSTSRDSDVILKNDRLFNESLDVTMDDAHDLEKVNQSKETIKIEDCLNTINSPIIEAGSVIEIDDNSMHVFDNQKSDEIEDNDSCCLEIVASNSKVRPKAESPIVVEDYYSSLDLNQVCNIDIPEIIDVDDVIAENKAIIEKYRPSNNIDIVTLVEPNFYNKARQESCVDILNSKTVPVSNISHGTLPSISTESTSEPITNLDILTSVKPNNNQKERIEANSDIIDCETFGNSAAGSVTHIVPTIPNSTNTRTLNYITPGDMLTINIDDQSDSENFRKPRNVPTPIIPIEGGNNVICVPNTNNLDDDITVIDNINKYFQNNGYSKHTNKNKINLKIKLKLKRLGFHQTQMSIGSENDMYLLQAAQLPREEPLPQASNCLRDCPICMESLSNSSIASTICGHVFCMKCLRAAIKASGKKCPTCRKALKGIGYHQIFL